MQHNNRASACGRTQSALLLFFRLSSVCSMLTHLKRFQTSSICSLVNSECRDVKRTTHKLPQRRQIHGFDSIRDSIRTEISDSHVPGTNVAFSIYVHQKRNMRPRPHFEVFRLFNRTGSVHIYGPHVRKSTQMLTSQILFKTQQT